MSYYTYLRTNIELNNNVKRLSTIIDDTVLILAKDDTLISYELIEDDNAYKYSYDFNQDVSDKSFSQFLENLILLISGCNIKGNKLLIETIWQGKPIGDKYYSYKTTVSYDIMSKDILKGFYALEEFDYRSILIEF